MPEPDRSGAPYVPLNIVCLCWCPPLLVQALRHNVVGDTQRWKGRISLDVPVMDVHQVVHGRGGQHPHAKPGISYGD